MKFKDLIELVDKSDKNKDWVSLSELAEREFNINQFITDDPNERLKAYYYFKWYCTDTYVGGRVYFLDDKPVAVSWQSGRKMNEVFTWMSVKAFEDTKAYLMLLISNEAEADFFNVITEKELEKEMEIGSNIEFSSQLLTDDVIYKSTNEPLKVVETYRDYSDIKSWNSVKVKFPNGDIKVVDLDEILVPYNINLTMLHS